MARPGSPAPHSVRLGSQFGPPRLSIRSAFASHVVCTFSPFGPLPGSPFGPHPLLNRFASAPRSFCIRSTFGPLRSSFGRLPVPVRSPFGAPKLPNRTASAPPFVSPCGLHLHTPHSACVRSTSSRPQLSIRSASAPHPVRIRYRLSPRPPPVRHPRLSWSASVPYPLPIRSSSAPRTPSAPHSVCLSDSAPHPVRIRYRFGPHPPSVRHARLIRSTSVPQLPIRSASTPRSVHISSPNSVNYTRSTFGPPDVGGSCTDVVSRLVVQPPFLFFPRHLPSCHKQPIAKKKAKKKWPFRLSTLPHIGGHITDRSSIFSS